MLVISKSYPWLLYHSVKNRLRVSETIAAIFAFRDSSGHVGYISDEATFLMYSENGTDMFGEFDAGVPR